MFHTDRQTDSRGRGELVEIRDFVHQNSLSLILVVKTAHHHASAGRRCLAVLRTLAMAVHPGIQVVAAATKPCGTPRMATGPGAGPKTVRTIARRPDGVLRLFLQVRREMGQPFSRR